jgi:hypothetical protein
MCWHELMAAAKVFNPVEDKFSKGILEAIYSAEIKKTPPIWFVYATQIFLDIHHIMRGDIGRGFEDLRTTAVRALLNVRDYVKFSGEEYYDPWEKGERTPHDVLNLIVNFVQKDWIGNIRKGFAGPGVVTPPFYLFNTHPTLCGLMVANITLSMQDLGITLADYWESIMAVAHAYNASLKSG